MSERPLHPCPGPHCGRPTRAPRCPACTRKRERLRGSAAARGYDEAWAEYSRAWLRRFPWCGQRLDGRAYPEHSVCTQRGERRPATVTDHIIALADGGARLDPMNHQSLCNSCNIRKARQSRKVSV